MPLLEKKLQHKKDLAAKKEFWLLIGDWNEKVEDTYEPRIIRKLELVKTIQETG